MPKIIENVSSITDITNKIDNKVKIKNDNRKYNQNYQWKSIIEPILPKTIENVSNITDTTNENR